MPVKTGISAKLIAVKANCVRSKCWDSAYLLRDLHQNVDGKILGMRGPNDVVQVQEHDKQGSAIFEIDWLSLGDSTSNQLGTIWRGSASCNCLRFYILTVVALHF